MTLWWDVAIVISLAFLVPGQRRRRRWTGHQENETGVSRTHRVHRVATAAFWRTFSDEGKISPGWWQWWGWGVHAHLLSLHLPSPVKLQCTLQLSGQIHWPCFISTNICTLWSYQPLRLPRKRSRQRGSRRLRRPDPARRHRRSGSLASYRRPSEGADPDTKTLPRGGEDRGVASRAAATVGPTVDREGRSEAASAAAGAAGRKFETVHTKGNWVRFKKKMMKNVKNSSLAKGKKKIEYSTGSNTDFLCKNIFSYTCKPILTVNISPG